MDLIMDKYDIEVQNDDTINCDQILFNFMQQTFSCLDGLYMDEKCLLIDTIKKINSIKQSTAEVEMFNRYNKNRNKKRRVFCK